MRSRVKFGVRELLSGEGRLSDLPPPTGIPTHSSHSALSSLQLHPSIQPFIFPSNHPSFRPSIIDLLLLCASRADFSQSDGPPGQRSHGQQFDSPRLPEPGIQPQQRRPCAGHHADGLTGQMEQEDGFSPVSHWIRGGLGQRLEVPVHLLSERRR